MADIAVAYHSDGYAAARPAVNVKDYHSGMDLVHEVEKLVGHADILLGPSDPTTHRYDRSLLDLAYERVRSDFWQTAAGQATERGLGPIEQEGRSGGWLVFTDGRDPQDPGTLCSDHIGDPCDWADTDGVKEWLAAYAAFAEWCAAEVAAAPERVARLAQDMAMDEIGRQSVALAPILHALGLNRAVLA